MTTARPNDPTADTAWYNQDDGTIAGVEKLRFFPQVAARGHGCTLVTPEGREVLDLSASWSATGFGHANPAIVQAVSEAVRHAPGASVLSGTHPEAVLLARELLELVETTGPDRRVYIGHAGTDANDVAIRAVRQATGRRRLVAFEMGYHGGLGTAMAVSGLHVAAGATADPDVVFLPYPDPYRPWTPEQSTLLERTLALVEDQLAAGNVAGVLVEPIQSDGGVLVPPAGFLHGLRQLTQQYGALLIIDEVKVGLGRTGHFLAHHAERVIPDMVTLGKALGGGLPLSAVVGPADALDAPPASALMTTIGNPVCCAAGRAVLGQLRDGKLARAAAQHGARLGDQLRSYAGSGRPGADRVGDVRGRGLALGVELVDPLTRARDGNLTAKAVYRGWQLGVIAYPVRDNVIELTPPLTITVAELDRAVQLLTRAIDDAALGNVTDEEIAHYTGW